MKSENLCRFADHEGKLQAPNLSGGDHFIRKLTHLGCETPQGELVHHGSRIPKDFLRISAHFFGDHKLSQLSNALAINFNHR